jgi:hypothetical protein
VERKTLPWERSYKQWRLLAGFQRQHVTTRRLVPRMYACATGDEDRAALPVVGIEAARKEHKAKERVEQYSSHAPNLPEPPGGLQIAGGTWVPRRWLPPPVCKFWAEAKSSLLFAWRV